MCAFVSTCHPVCPHVGLFGYMWTKIAHMKLHLVHMHSFEYRWTNVGPSAHVGQCGLVCVHRLTYVYMVPCEHMWVYVSTCESMWGHVTSWKHILAMWDYMSLCAYMWAHVQVVYLCTCVCVHVCSPMYTYVSLCACKHVLAHGGTCELQKQNSLWVRPSNTET